MPRLLSIVRTLAGKIATGSAMTAAAEGALTAAEAADKPTDVASTSKEDAGNG